MKNNGLVLNKSNLSNFISILILLLPLIKYYQLPVIGISVETIFKIIIFIFCLLIVTFTQKDKKDFNLKKSSLYFKLFCSWLIIITFIFEAFTNINIYNENSNYTYNTFIMLIPTILSLSIILEGRIRSEHFFKTYEKFVMVIVIIYLIQYCLFFFGQYISFKIPIFDYADSYAYLEPYIFGMTPQPTSLFSEKAHLCEFLLPYVAICLYSKKYNKNIIKAILISIIIISTISGNGIIALLIEWITYFLLFGKIKSAHRLLMICIFPIILLVIYNYLLTIPAFNRMSKELFVNTTGKYTQTKADYRVYRGFDYYFKLPPLEKITGVGYSHMKVFSKEHNISSKYDHATAGFEFFSTVTQVLLYSGIIGFAFFTLHIYKLWQCKSNLVKGLITMSVAIWFSSQMLFSEVYYIYIFLIVASYIEYKNKGVEKNG